mmetsp:Transcript_33702/g.77763  ORF Transcript_33702/g.77763 Transcript_33702/m.77763 type:complete len:308 (+) Transcript_33702:244-1167(+)
MHQGAETKVVTTESAQEVKRPVRTKRLPTRSTKEVSCRNLQAGKAALDDRKRPGPEMKTRSAPVAKRPDLRGLATSPKSHTPAHTMPSQAQISQTPTRDLGRRNYPSLMVDPSLDYDQILAVASTGWSPLISGKMPEERFCNPAGSPDAIRSGGCPTHGTQVPVHPGSVTMALFCGRPSFSATADLTAKQASVYHHTQCNTETGTVQSCQTGIYVHEQTRSIGLGVHTGGPALTPPVLLSRASSASLAPIPLIRNESLAPIPLTRDVSSSFFVPFVGNEPQLFHALGVPNDGGVGHITKKEPREKQV